MHYLLQQAQEHQITTCSHWSSEQEDPRPEPGWGGQKWVSNGAFHLTDIRHGCHSPHPETVWFLWVLCFVSPLSPYSKWVLLCSWFGFLLVYGVWMVFMTYCDLVLLCLQIWEEVTRKMEKRSKRVITLRFRCISPLCVHLYHKLNW